VRLLSCLSRKPSGSRQPRKLALLAAWIALAVSRDPARKELQACSQAYRRRAGVLHDAFDWTIAVGLVPRVHFDETAPHPYRYG